MYDNTIHDRYGNMNSFSVQEKKYPTTNHTYISSLRKHYFATGEIYQNTCT